MGRGGIRLENHFSREAHAREVLEARKLLLRAALFAISISFGAFLIGFMANFSLHHKLYYYYYYSALFMLFQFGLLVLLQALREVPGWLGRAKVVMWTTLVLVHLVLALAAYALHMIPDYCSEKKTFMNCN